MATREPLRVICIEGPPDSDPLYRAEIKVQGVWVSLGTYAGLQLAIKRALDVSAGYDLADNESVAWSVP